MIGKKSNDITLIIYDSPSPPKCIKVKKPVLKSFLIFIPLIVFCSVALSIYLTTNLKILELQTKRKQPKMINSLKGQLAEAIKKRDETLKLNQELTYKISQGSPNIGVNANLFNLPLGFVDKSEQSLAKIDKIEFEVQENLAQIKFQLINNGEPGSKLSGHIFVVQINGPSVQFYPDSPLNIKGSYFKYNSGETFTASRFRPVIAKFKVHDKDEDIHFQVFIFSRSGDLILKQNIGPYGIEN